MNTCYTLEGRTVLITGANRGLGRALLEEALNRGAARVYAATRTPFEHSDDRVVALAVDLTDLGSIKAAAAAVPALDVLINNAAVGTLGEDPADVAVLLQRLQVNAIAPAALTSQLLPALAKSRGRVVNIGSIAAIANVPVMASYSISKAAAMSLTQAQRALLARQGVRVHLVLAGPLDTDMSAALEIPKAAPTAVASTIFDGVARGDEDIFPDPMSEPLARDWGAGLIKTFERANAELLPKPDYTTTFVVSKSPSAVFAAINDPRNWWDGEVSGKADELGAEFTYVYPEQHMSVQRVVELIPSERVVWEVLSSKLGFVNEPEPWTGTKIAFDLKPAGEGTEVTLTHHGLVPALDCYDACSAGWDHAVGRSLRQFIETGRGVTF